MTFNRVGLESVDLEDQRFRISERLDSLRLLESLRQIGQLSPVCLQACNGSRLAVICGFRRLRALRSLGQADVLARIWDEGEQTNLELFRIALWENLSHRELSPLEKARVLTSLKNHCEVPYDQLVEIYLPGPGIGPAQEYAAGVPGAARSQSALEGDVERWAHHLGQRRTSCVRGAAVSKPDERSAGAGTVERQPAAGDTGPSRGTCGHCRVRSRDNSERERSGGIVADASLSPFQKGERIHRLLYRKRNPRLCRTEERFRAHEKELRLPHTIRVSPAPYFESPDLRVEFNVRSSQDFREAAQASGARGGSARTRSPFLDCGFSIENRGIRILGGLWRESRVFMTHEIQ